ncbi:MAG: nucleoside transporter rane protein [Clostridiales bacterium]|jgi:simple sugar transport system permease protein|nr:nucleoside transporter rane protein [Clostridiales bacterium]
MFNLTKRTNQSKIHTLLLQLGAIVAALVAAGIVMWAMGYNPFVIYTKIVEGSVMVSENAKKGGVPYRLLQTINKAIPLVILSLGVSVAYKMKFWNIGAEGQFYIGALFAAYVAFNFKQLPPYILLPFMFLSAFIGGGLWGFIPAVLKNRFNASESLTTLMMNYIAIGIVTYLQLGPWRDPEAKGFGRMPYFTENAILPKVFGIHIGFIIALILAVIIFVLLKKTKLGYEIAVIGENETTAKYAGINTAKVLFITLFISGGICGIAGMIQASGIEKTLTDQISGGLGFTAIITAWLAKLSAPIILVVSFLFAMLLQGGAYLQVSMQIPAAISEVIQGIILFFVLGSEFFIQYKIVFSSKIKEAK